MHWGSKSTKAKLKGLETKQYTCMVLTHPLWVSIMKGERETPGGGKTHNGVREPCWQGRGMCVYSWLCTHMESFLASWPLCCTPIFSLTERSLRVLVCVRTCVKQRKWTGVSYFTKPKLTCRCSFFLATFITTHTYTSHILLNLVCPTYFFARLTCRACLLHFQEVEGLFVECEDPRWRLEGQCWLQRGGLDEVQISVKLHVITVSYMERWVTDQIFVHSENWSVNVCGLFK